MNDRRPEKHPALQYKLTQTRRLQTNEVYLWGTYEFRTRGTSGDFTAIWSGRRILEPHFNNRPAQRLGNLLQDKINANHRLQRQLGDIRFGVDSLSNKGLLDTVIDMARAAEVHRRLLCSSRTIKTEQRHLDTEAGLRDLRGSLEDRLDARP